MTPAQMKWYRGQWAKVEAVLLKNGFDKEAAEEYRLDLHRELGLPASSKNFNKTTHLDKFISACRKFLGLPDVDMRDQARKRLVHLIGGLGFNDTYLNSICSDKKVGLQWQAMPPEELKKLLFTAKNRRKSLAAKS